MANDPTQAAIFIDKPAPTTYYAIGKYHIHASNAEKISACLNTIREATLHAVELGAPLVDVLDALSQASDDAEWEVNCRGG